jgi:hypothetical protein
MDHPSREYRYIGEREKNAQKHLILLSDGYRHSPSPSLGWLAAGLVCWIITETVVFLCTRHTPKHTHKNMGIMGYMLYVTSYFLLPPFRFVFSYFFYPFTKFHVRCTVGTESIRTAERISRENAFFKTLPKIEFSVDFDKIFFKG